MLEFERVEDESEGDEEGKAAAHSIEEEDDIGKSRQRNRYSVYLPARTIYALTGEARWKWKHGIAERYYDEVEDALADDHSGDESGSRSTTKIIRDVRVSITMRWMKEDANVLSENGEDDWNVR